MQNKPQPPHFVPKSHHVYQLQSQGFKNKMLLSPPKCSAMVLRYAAPPFSAHDAALAQLRCCVDAALRSIAIFSPCGEIQS